MTIATSAGRYLDRVKKLLVQKAKIYGDSAADPVGVFSRTDAIERIQVRIDEKLSRVARGSFDIEDSTADLIGLLAIRQVLKRRKSVKRKRLPGVSLETVLNAEMKDPVFKRVFNELLDNYRKGKRKK